VRQNRKGIGMRLSGGVTWAVEFSTGIYFILVSCVCFGVKEHICRCLEWKEGLRPESSIQVSNIAPSIVDKNICIFTL